MVKIVIPKEIKEVLDKILENGFEAYLVGGAVRDYMLHRRSNDFDIATNALPADIVKIFGPSYKTIQYGCYNMRIGSYNVDITTYRKEEAYEGRNPSKITYTNNLLLDAERRDFTINAFYMNRNEEIIDLYDGQKDIKRKIIRAIGNPTTRVREDPLRILRAVRFASIYKFNLEKNLANAIKRDKKMLNELSLTRIKKELDGILLADGFTLLRQLNLLKELQITTKSIVYVNDLSGLWAQIKTEVEYPQTKSLKMRQKNIEEILKYDTINMQNLYRFGYYDCLVAAQIMKYPLKKLEALERKMPIHSRKDIALQGKDIGKITHIQGRELGVLIEQIENLILLGKLKNEREEIVTYLKNNGY